MPGRILGLAWPILIGQLAVMAYALVDTLLTGHATPADLAAMGVGASVYGAALVYLRLQPAYRPLLGGPRGAQGLWLMLALSLAFTACLLLSFYLWVVRRQETSYARAPSSSGV
jgi:MATE family multidrug resistance protein